MPPLRVLYVTERFDGPYRYRCRQACEQLRADGAVANVLHIGDAALLRELPRYGTVVLFRLPWSERVESVVLAARLAGLPVLLDMDDLLFDPTLDHLMSFRNRYGPDEWARTYGRQMIGLRRTLDTADAFIGSTPELALHATRLGKKSHVHRNVVPEHYLTSGVWTERVRGALRSRPTIGYFSGSDTHDEDFASIAPALVRALASSPNARLLVVGYLGLGAGDDEIERRVVRLPYMHWRDFALAYAACHVTLAPLAVRNAFTDSKSALKFFEAGAFFTPTVATPVREMEAAISNGATGFVATTEDEWTAAIRSALTEETSARLGRAARIAVERHHSMAALRGALRAILEEYAIVPAGPPPDPTPLDLPDETGQRRSLDRMLRPGRAARDVIRILRATRRDPGSRPDPEKSVGSSATVTPVLEKAPPVSVRDVDIVVPVWNATELVLKCLGSVVAHARGNYRLVVVDDASTEPQTLPALEAFARRHAHVVVLRNPKNLGFVGTANRGIAHAGVRDVLLLNSDTEVFAEFLERIRACAYSKNTVGLVSPLSNNATICSVPEFCRENEVPEGLTAAEMATLVALSSERRRPELVTPHGFCLYLRRDCLEDIGILDEKRFGRGFGEENDLGERAKTAGWKILLADDVYVWHAGKASFGDAGLALERRNQQTLEKRHPGYHAAVSTFIRDNPLAPVHADLRRHLTRASHRVLPAPLFVLHTTPFSAALGGVEQGARDLLRAMALPRTVLVYPEGGALEVAEIFGGEVDRPSRYRFPLDRPPERCCHEHAEAVRVLGEILTLYRIGWVHFHHLMFFPLSIGRLLRERRIPYVVTVHDLYLACPSTVPPDPVVSVEHHRRLSAELLGGAVRVLFPSPNTQERTSAMLPLDESRTAIVPHGYRMPDPVGTLHLGPAAVFGFEQRRAWAEYHRSLYAECAAQSDVTGPRATEEAGYRRLNEVATARSSKGPATDSVTRPSPRYTAAWWYAYAERAKPYAPESLRHIVRRRMAGDKARPVLRFRLPGRSARLGQQLTLDRRYMTTSLLTSHGGDPQIFLDLLPLDPARIQMIRFNLWCAGARAVHARLYFKHQGAPDFDESHCILFPLDGRASDWQEYSTRLDLSDRARAWYDGGPIVALRFDPIDKKGRIGLGELALCEIRGP